MAQRRHRGEPAPTNDSEANWQAGKTRSKENWQRRAAMEESHLHTSAALPCLRGTSRARGSGEQEAPRSPRRLGGGAPVGDRLPQAAGQRLGEQLADDAAVLRTAPLPPFAGRS